MKQILIPISGGLDSAFVLWKYLTETNHPIHAHHISLYSKHEFRIHQENKAVDDIVSWLKKHTRDFKVSKSSFINPLGGKDITLILFTMSQIAHNLLRADIDEIEIATGRIIEDDQRAPIHTQDEVFLAGVKDITIPIRLVRPIRHMTKKQIMNDMPDILKSLTWSCRQPKFINGVAVECMNCHSCKEKYITEKNNNVRRTIL